MITILTILHVVVGLSLILIVLLQTGKGATMGAAFGGSSQTVFGSAGASGFLGKVTTSVAIVFMLTSLSLAYFSSKNKTASIVTEAESIMDTPVTTENQPAEQEKKPIGTQQTEQQGNSENP